MKIIYIANARIPTEKAHGVQIMNMCGAFKKSGAEIELLAAKRFNTLKDDPFNYYGIQEKFPIRKLFVLDFIPLRLSKIFGRIVLWLQNITFAFSASIYLLFRKSDLIYSRDEFSLFLLSFFKNNLVFELHNFPRSNFFLYNYLLKKIKFLVVINNGLKELAVKNFDFSEDKILVAYDGVDLKKFNVNITQKEARARLNLPIDKKIVFCNSGLWKRKGVYTLADSSVFLDNDVLFYFAGGAGKELKDFQDYIEKHNLSRVIALGYQKNVKMPVFMAAADVLALPNSGTSPMSAIYTSPMKLFEYMASERPIAASSVPAVREVLNDSNSILFPPDNPELLAKAITRALNDYELSKSISNQARKDVQEYTWQKRAAIILNFLKKDGVSRLGN